MGTNEDTLHSRISQLLGPFLYKQGLEQSLDPKSMFCNCAVPNGWEMFSQNYAALRDP